MPPKAWKDLSLVHHQGWVHQSQMQVLRDASEILIFCTTSFTAFTFPRTAGILRIPWVPTVPGLWVLTIGRYNMSKGVNSIAPGESLQKWLCDFPYYNTEVALHPAQQDPHRRSRGLGQSIRYHHNFHFGDWQRAYLVSFAVKLNLSWTYSIFRCNVCVH